MNQIVEVKHLQKVFGENTAVTDVSFTVKEGICFGLLGPKGAAKTTTLGSKNISDKVNLEVDLISKYIEKHLKGDPRGGGINNDLMVKMGFLPMDWTDN